MSEDKGVYRPEEQTFSPDIETQKQQVQQEVVETGTAIATDSETLITTNKEVLETLTPYGELQDDGSFMLTKEMPKNVEMKVNRLLLKQDLIYDKYGGEEEFNKKVAESNQDISDLNTIYDYQLKKGKAGEMVQFLIDERLQDIQDVEKRSPYYDRELITPKLEYLNAIQEFKEKTGQEKLSREEVSYYMNEKGITAKDPINMREGTKLAITKVFSSMPLGETIFKATGKLTNEDLLGKLDTQNEFTRQDFNQGLSILSKEFGRTDAGATYRKGVTFVEDVITPDTYIRSQENINVQDLSKSQKFRYGMTQSSNRLKETIFDYVRERPAETLALASAVTLTAGLSGLAVGGAKAPVIVSKLTGAKTITAGGAMATSISLQVATPLAVVGGTMVGEEIAKARGQSDFAYTTTFRNITSQARREEISSQEGKTFLGISRRGVAEYLPYGNLLVGDKSEYEQSVRKQLESEGITGERADLITQDALRYRTSREVAYGTSLIFAEVGAEVTGGVIARGLPASQSRSAFRRGFSRGFVTATLSAPAEVYGGMIGTNYAQSREIDVATTLSAVGVASPIAGIISGVVVGGQAMGKAQAPLSATGWENTFGGKLSKYTLRTAYVLDPLEIVGDTIVDKGVRGVNLVTSVTNAVIDATPSGEVIFKTQLETSDITKARERKRNLPTATTTDSNEFTIDYGFTQTDTDTQTYRQLNPVYNPATSTLSSESNQIDTQSMTLVSGSPINQQLNSSSISVQNSPVNQQLNPNFTSESALIESASKTSIPVFSQINFLTSTSSTAFNPNLTSTSTSTLTSTTTDTPTSQMTFTETPSFIPTSTSTSTTTNIPTETSTTTATSTTTIVPVGKFPFFLPSGGWDSGSGKRPLKKKKKKKKYQAGFVGITAGIYVDKAKKGTLTGQEIRGIVRGTEKKSKNTRYGQELSFVSKRVRKNNPLFKVKY